MTGMHSSTIHSHLLLESRRASTVLSRLTSSFARCLEAFSPRAFPFEPLAEVARKLDEVELLQQLLDRLGAHVDFEGVAVFLAACLYSSSVRSCRSLSGGLARDR